MLSIIVFHAFFEYDLSSAWRFIRLLQPIWLSVVGEIIFGVGFVSSGTFGNLLTFFLQVNIACKFEFWMKKKKFFHRGSKSRTNSRNFSQTDVIQCAEIKRKCVFYHPLNIKIKIIELFESVIHRFVEFSHLQSSMFRGRLHILNVEERNWKKFFWCGIKILTKKPPKVFQQNKSNFVCRN